MTFDTSAIFGDNSGSMKGIQLGVTMKWYAEEVFSPDDGRLDRKRTRASFEVPDGAEPQAVALAAMMACGWERPVAEPRLAEDADLGWVDFEDEQFFDFEIFGDTGTWTYAVSPTPFSPSPPKFVITGLNNEPVAVRFTRYDAEMCVEALCKADPDLAGVLKTWEVADAG